MENQMIGQVNYEVDFVFYQFKNNLHLHCDGNNAHNKCGERRNSSEMTINGHLCR